MGFVEGKWACCIPVCLSHGNPRAKEQAKQKKEAQIMFQMGQRAYGRGVYDKSVEILEAALTKVPRASNLGGEVNLSYLPT
jgi:hypothetical protein